MDKEPQLNVTLSVTRGRPTPAELAALVVALTSLSAPADKTRARSVWSAKTRQGWKESALPR